MLLWDDAHLRIVGSRGEWQAQHSRRRVNSPGALFVHGREAAVRFFCEIGDVPDDMAVAETVRASRKANVQVVTCRGVFPYGSGVGIRHRTRYAGHLARVTTDVRIPPRTTLRRHVGIGNCDLGNEWRRYRTLTLDGEAPRLSPWQALPAAAPMIWRPPLPPALVFADDHGRQLEIGLGNDLWRWHAGIQADDRPAGAEIRLAGEHGSYTLRRHVVIRDGEFDVAPRLYRFSWYAAWWGDAAAAPTADAVDVAWAADSKIEAAALRRAATTAGPAGIALDLRRGQWRASLCRRWTTPTTAPCLAAPAVITRLKRLMRRVDAALPPGVPVTLRGLGPGPCRCGRHMQRRGELEHWDMAGLIEFSLWMRQLCRDRRAVHHDAAARLDCPSQYALFQEMEFGDELPHGP